MKRSLRSFVCFFFPLFAVFAVFSAVAEDDVAAPQKFLERARRPAGSGTWGKFYGMARHKRRGGEMERSTVYFAVHLQRERMIGQIILGDEAYLIGQNFNNAIGTVSPQKPGGYGRDSVMSRFGISPSDLTMSFLYYPLARELPGESLKLIKCRVFELDAPAEAGGGKVKVWVAENYFTTLKAEFFRPEEEAPFRTLEVESYRKKNDLYYVETLNLYGSGWRTQIRFDQADLGFLDPGKPVNIYKKL